MDTSPEREREREREKDTRALEERARKPIKTPNSPNSHSTNLSTRRKKHDRRGLSPPQVAALFGWTTGDFRFVNPVARGADGVSFDELPPGFGFAPVRCSLTRREVLPYVAVLVSALQALPAPVRLGARVWRGHARAVPAECGQILLLPGFTSCSYSADEAIRFATQHYSPLKCGARSLLVIDEHSSGRDVRAFSARRREAEVLFPADTAFEVLTRLKVQVDDEHSSSSSQQASSAALAPDVRAALRDALREMRRASPAAELEVVHLREVTGEARGARPVM